MNSNQRTYVSPIANVSDVYAAAEEQEAMYTPIDQIAAAEQDLDTMRAVQDTYPALYHNWYHLFLNSPIDMAERRFAEFMQAGNLHPFTVRNAHRWIGGRESLPEDLKENDLAILAAADRNTQYELMAKLA